MDQDDARSLARMVGGRATEIGCEPTDVANPTVAELAWLCSERGIDLHDVLADC